MESTITKEPEKRFYYEPFRQLFLAIIHQRGYSNLKDFAVKNNFPRNPLSRAVNGQTVPRMDNLNKWIGALGCSPEERSALIATIYDAGFAAA